LRIRPPPRLRRDPLFDKSWLINWRTCKILFIFKSKLQKIAQFLQDL
jgi:hypothetical protein